MKNAMCSKEFTQSHTTESKNPNFQDKLSKTNLELAKNDHRIPKNSAHLKQPCFLSRIKLTPCMQIHLNFEAHLTLIIKFRDLEHVHYITTKIKINQCNMLHAKCIDKNKK